MTLRLYRGDSYAFQVRTWHDDAHTDPLPLTGATAAGRIDHCDGSAMDLECAVTLPNLIDVVLPATLWNGTHCTCGGSRKGRWDLQLTWSDGRVYTLVSGPVSVSEDVTP